MNMTIHLNGMIYQRPLESVPGSHGLYIIPAKCCGNAGLVNTPQLYRSLLVKNPDGDAVNLCEMQAIVTSG